MSLPRDIVLLGSTGSIGTQAIDIVRAHPDQFRTTGSLCLTEIRCTSE